MTKSVELFIKNSIQKLNQYNDDFLYEFDFTLFLILFINRERFMF